MASQCVCVAAVRVACFYSLLPWGLLRCSISGQLDEERRRGRVDFDEDGHSGCGSFVAAAPVEYPVATTPLPVGAPHRLPASALPAEDVEDSAHGEGSRYDMSGAAAFSSAAHGSTDTSEDGELCDEGDASVARPPSTTAHLDAFRGLSALAHAHVFPSPFPLAHQLVNMLSAYAVPSSSIGHGGASRSVSPLPSSPALFALCTHLLNIQGATFTSDPCAYAHLCTRHCALLRTYTPLTLAN